MDLVKNQKNQKLQLKSKFKNVLNIKKSKF